MGLILQSLVESIVSLTPPKLRIRVWIWTALSAWSPRFLVVSPPTSPRWPTDEVKRSFSSRRSARVPGLYTATPSASLASSILKQLSRRQTQFSWRENQIWGRHGAPIAPIFWSNASIIKTGPRPPTRTPIVILFGRNKPETPTTTS
ncbi:hypothetical protein RRG08_040300 [Elysia crispata]|uniref:Uncharacterized protein n=1 Tax=Elysia crispata TaxID=231223 RepID=A0AAE0Z2G4_9GAST|nr:hypothetical protein RRG08_040300 [Elysia crispata]